MEKGIEYMKTEINKSKSLLGILEKDEKLLESVGAVSDEIVNTYRKGGKVVTFGNGGSAADAQHFAAELEGRFKMERPSLAAVAITANSSTITAIGNDYGFENIFERVVGDGKYGLVKEGDVAVGISTSGSSDNVIRGLKQAKKIGAKTVLLTSGRCRKRSIDYVIKIPSEETQKIQLAHLELYHCICGLVEKKLFRRQK